ncbi:MAG: septum formation initiator family protein [Acidobacteria bacterium]|nr:septum formation initiator family protein [Acidobacteriota bacterium]
MSKKTGFNKKLLISLLAVALLLIGLYTFFGSNGLMEVLRRKNMEKDLNSELADIKQQNLELRAKIWSLKNRMFEVERLAREQLFLIKPGEKVYLVKELEE